MRSEGGGALALGAQPGSGAWPLVAGSAVRQDGRSASLTAPNGAAQKVLLGTALYVAGVGIEQLRYVETHGTGTALGDPIEVRFFFLRFSESFCVVVGGRRYKGIVQADGTWKCSHPVHVPEVEHGSFGGGRRGRGPGVACCGAADGFGRGC